MVVNLGSLLTFVLNHALKSKRVKTSIGSSFGRLWKRVEVASDLEVLVMEGVLSTHVWHGWTAVLQGRYGKVWGVHHQV